MSRSAVITGLGTVGPAGTGTADLWRALSGEKAKVTELGALGPLAGRADGRLPWLRLRPEVRWAGLVDPSSLGPWLRPGEARRMSRPSRFAVAAARMALDDARYRSPHLKDVEDGDDVDGGKGTQGDDSRWSVDSDDLGVILSTTFGPTAVTEELLEQILVTGPEAASPFLFAESVANAPAAQVARLIGARGANLTVAERDAGALIAVRRAAGEVVAGRGDAMLAGAVDETTPLLQALLDRLGLLARGTAHEPPLPRPFDRSRNGVVLGEGSTVLLLEEEGALAARGGRALGRVVAGGEAFDSTAERCRWGNGHELLGRALLGVLERSGLGPQDVDLVVSGASGSRAGDRMEALTLRSAWAAACPEAPLPPVLAPKATLGELGGGHLAAAVALLGGVPEGCTLASPAGFREVDPELGIRPHAGPLPEAGDAPRRILVQTVSAGGPASWLVLEAPGKEGHP